MIRLLTFFSLVVLFVVYSAVVYTTGTESGIRLTTAEQQLINKGKSLYQAKNCQACHQLYGLGGYLGPDLTTAFSDKHRGPGLIRALLRSGGNLMPDFKFSNQQIDELIAYLKYVDTTATPIKETRAKIQRGLSNR
ncbi:MAG TPA: cytochrome c [Flavisolibacter sp.]|nr:cytochrome c [Flavisolibacter sp.]